MPCLDCRNRFECNNVDLMTEEECQRAHEANNELPVYEEAEHVCEHCGQAIDPDDCIMTDDGNYFCDYDCANDEEYYLCDNCGEYVRSNDSVYVDDYWFCCCECAYNAGYSTCYDCGEWVHTDYLRYHEADGVDYCESCYGDHEEEVLDYHDNDKYGTYDFVFKGDTKGGTRARIGIECEMEFGERLEFLQHFNEEYSTSDFKATKDGSLDYDSGIECISTAMTFTEHYDTWDKFTKFAKEHGYESYNKDNGEAGQHINISFENTNMAVVGVKMLRIMQRFENAFRRWELSKREHWRYCNFTGAGYSYEPTAIYERFGVGKTIDDENIANIIASAERGSHSLVVNLSHVNNEYNHAADRIELRLFGGSLDPEEIVQRVAFAEGLALVCKNNNAQFIEWCSWKHLKEAIYEELKAVDKTAYFVCKSWLSEF